MKIVILGSYPTYAFSNELGIDVKNVERITTWNENLAIELSKISGLDVTFITSTKSIEKTKKVVRGNLKVIYFVSPPKFNMFTFFYYTVFKVKKMINKINPDIVHGIGTEHIWPTIATKFKKNVITVHGILHIFNRNEEIGLLNLKRYFAFHEKRILLKNQNIISINPFVNNVCDKINSKHSYYNISNPISPLFQNVSATPNDSKQILFIGDFEVRKNISLLTNTIIKYKLYNDYDFRIKIIGRIRDRDYFETVMNNIPQKLFNIIEIKKFMLPKDIAYEMSKSSMLVQTSLNETAPMVIAEAMTVGLPVIAADVGGVKHMIQNEKNGFVIKSDSEEDLYKYLKKLLDDENLRKEIGDKAKNYALKQYDSKIIAKKTLDVYKKIISND